MVQIQSSKARTESSQCARTGKKEKRRVSQVVKDKTRFAILKLLYWEPGKNAPEIVRHLVETETMADTRQKGKRIYEIMGKLEDAGLVRSQKLEITIGKNSKGVLHWFIEDLGRRAFELDSLSMKTIADARFCALLSEMLAAPKERGAPTPPSAVFKEISVEYDITPEGRYRAKHNLSLLQLTNSQLIPTAVLFGPKKIPEIRWNDADIDVHTFVETDDIKEKMNIPQKVSVGYYSIKIENSLSKMNVGGTNNFTMEYDSALPVCEVGNNIYSSCFPVFFALDRTHMLIKLPKEFRDIVAIMMEKEWQETHWSTKWAKSKTQPTVVRNSVIFRQNEMEPDDWKEYLIRRRYRPSLLRVTFGRAKSDLRQSIFMINKKKPLHIGDSLTYFCGFRECPLYSSAFL